jgi:ribosomal protein S18 acetylase RimI-like enzyme
MSAPKYLIDTNVFIGLEDWQEVSPEFAALTQTAAKHGVGVFVHEVARDDLARDSDPARRRVSLSKIAKFPLIAKVRGLTKAQLEADFGDCPRHNDVVDATLLHALNLGVADFVVTQDRGLHDRARRHAPHLSRRVLYVADALQLLRSTYEPLEVSLPFVEETDAHTIPTSDPIFDSLREGYPGFDRWWAEKCVKAMRKCWVVIDDGILAGIVVRKDEAPGDTDAHTPGDKILKVCTFKVRPESRGIKLGELLLKQVLWFAQSNRYEVVYLTTFLQQTSLIDLLEYYGFMCTYTTASGELVYEKRLYSEPLDAGNAGSFFDAARLNYPRFCAGQEVEAYGIPIKEAYHEILFPEIADRRQADLFHLGGFGAGPHTPGNTIRKVYLCRAPASIDQPGAILLFYKGRSMRGPSQALTTVGIFEDMALAHSVAELRRLAGGRSVYSERQLLSWEASPDRPVKVINFLLAGHINPPISLSEMRLDGLISSHPPQSIFRISRDRLTPILRRIHLGFEL